jgi:hypothetical protein
MKQVVNPLFQNNNNKKIGGKKERTYQLNLEQFRQQRTRDPPPIYYTSLPLQKISIARRDLFFLLNIRGNSPIAKLKFCNWRIPIKDFQYELNFERVEREDERDRDEGGKRFRFEVAKGRN